MNNTTEKHWYKKWREIASIAFFAFNIFFLIIGCNNSKDNTSKDESQLKYNIISIDNSSTPGKVWMEVELETTPKNLEEFERVNDKIRNDNESEYLIIQYFLKDFPKALGYIAFAIVNYNPTKDISIIGQYPDDEKKAIDISSNINGNLIGIYSENHLRPNPTVYSFYESNSKFYKKSVYYDFSDSISEVSKIITKNGTKFLDKPTNTHGEYLIISKSDTLEFFNKENRKFGKARKVGKT